MKKRIIFLSITALLCILYLNNMSLAMMARVECTGKKTEICAEITTTTEFPDGSKTTETKKVYGEKAIIE